MPLHIHKLTFNPIQENMYVVYDETNECAIIDPGCYFQDEREALRRFIADHNLQPKWLLNTHCHLDHICGNAFVAREYQLQLAASSLDAYNLDLSIQAGKAYNMPIEPSPAIDIALDERSTIQFGTTTLYILNTPGHSTGHISFYAKEAHCVFSGDCLFHRSIGRTDLPGGDWDTLIDSIQTQLFSLPIDTVVYSGHGIETTIGDEIKYNPFFIA